MTPSPAIDFTGLPAAEVLDASGPLGLFNRAGVLHAADVHVAEAIARLAGEPDAAVHLGIALAVRATRLGNVCVAVDRIAAEVAVEDLGRVGGLDWPDPADWVQRLQRSPAVAGPQEGLTERPLVLDGTRLYLERYWRYERDVAAAVLGRTDQIDRSGDSAEDMLTAGAEALFGEPADTLQELAVRYGLHRRLTVLAGGPGTGKTWTLARLLAVLARPGPDGSVPRVALTAPTGKAAARMRESLAEAAATLPVEDTVGEQLLATEATTIHRLLGRRTATRFWHDRDHPLPHDVVVVDETSMVALSLMAKLLEALRPQARLVLVGDPNQLVAVEAGSVLADLVGPLLEDRAASGPLADHVVVLRRVHRYAEASGIAQLADAVVAGDADRALGVLESAPADVEWIRVDADGAPHDDEPLAAVRDAVRSHGASVATAARAGDGHAALAARTRFQVLCAHRRGPWGVEQWNPRIERWLGRDAVGYDRARGWYAGRPVLVTRNDPHLRLANGDLGVVVTGTDGRLVVAFGGPEIIAQPPSRLEAVETAHALTIHKSQGSQFDHVVVVLPEPASRILSRELLYTAVTRARSRVTVVGSPEAIRAAVDRPLRRASGLRAALWG